MDRTLIRDLRRKFEDAATSHLGVEAWFARDLQLLLDYDEWRNFQKAIEKAITACANSGEDPGNHFVEVNKMVQIGSGTERGISDYLVSRYGCYLIAQNADPKKSPVAFAQTYFALQTRSFKGGSMTRASPSSEARAIPRCSEAIPRST